MIIKAAMPAGNIDHTCPNQIRKAPSILCSGTTLNETFALSFVIPSARRAAPTALTSSSRFDPQPFRAGLTFGGRPSGPRIHGDLAVSFLSRLATGKSVAPICVIPTERRDLRFRRPPWKPGLPLLANSSFLREDHRLDERVQWSRLLYYASHQLLVHGICKTPSFP